MPPPTALSPRSEPFTSSNFDQPSSTQRNYRNNHLRVQPQQKEHEGFASGQPQDTFEHKTGAQHSCRKVNQPTDALHDQKDIENKKRKEFNPDHKLSMGGKVFEAKLLRCHADVVHRVEQDLQARLDWQTLPGQVQISVVSRSELKERLVADWDLGRDGLLAKIGAWCLSFFISTYYSPSLDSNDALTGERSVGRILVVARNARSHSDQRLKNQLAQALTLAAIHQHTAVAYPPYSDIYSFLADYLRNPHRHRAELHGVSAAMYALAQNVAQKQAPITHAESRWQRVGQWILRPWMADFLKPMAIGRKLQKTMGRAISEDPQRIHRAFLTGEVWSALCCKTGVLELVYNADRHPKLTYAEEVRRDAVYFAKMFNPKAHAVSFTVTSLNP